MGKFFIYSHSYLLSHSPPLHLPCELHFSNFKTLKLFFEISTANGSPTWCPARRKNSLEIFIIVGSSSHFDILVLYGHYFAYVLFKWFSSATNTNGIGPEQCTSDGWHWRWPRSDRSQVPISTCSTSEKCRLWYSTWRRKNSLATHMPFEEPLP